jgi:hypothetical protein
MPDAQQAHTSPTPPPLQQIQSLIGRLERARAKQEFEAVHDLEFQLLDLWNKHSSCQREAPETVQTFVQEIAARATNAGMAFSDSNFSPFSSQLPHDDGNSLPDSHETVPTTDAST